MDSIKLKPFIKWTGGKTRVLEQIVPYFKDYDDCYVEPFLGGGSVLFRLQPKNAIVADINSNLIITYKMVKTSVDKVITLLKKYQMEYPEYVERKKTKKGERRKNLTPREVYFYKKRDRYNEIKFYENDIGNAEKSDKNIELASLFLFLNKTAFNGMYR